jgi:hypothetical protein
VVVALCLLRLLELLFLLLLVVWRRLQGIGRVTTEGALRLLLLFLLLLQLVFRQWLGGVADGVAIPLLIIRGWKLRVTSCSVVCGVAARWLWLQRVSEGGVAVAIGRGLLLRVFTGRSQQLRGAGAGCGRRARRAARRVRG